MYEPPEQRLSSGLAISAAAFVFALVGLGATIVFIVTVDGPVFPILGMEMWAFVPLIAFVLSMVWLTALFIDRPLAKPTPYDGTAFWIGYRFFQLVKLFWYLFTICSPFLAVAMIVTCFYILVGQVQSVAHKWSLVETQCSVSPDCNVTAERCADAPIFNLAAMLNETDLGLDAEEICSSMTGFGCFLEDSNPCDYGVGFKLAVAEVWSGAMAAVAFCGFWFAAFISCSNVWLAWKEAAPSRQLRFFLAGSFIFLCLPSLILSVLNDTNRDSDYSSFRAVEVMTYESTPECFGYKRASYLLSHNDTYTLGYGQCDGTFGEHSPSRLEDVRFNKTDINTYRGEIYTASFYPLGSAILTAAFVSFFVIGHTQIGRVREKGAGSHEMSEHFLNADAAMGVHV
eukprot:TRINITY_DN481_c2_g1_i4.p1 TRINITY_DN481_c2_g1~~TRINITY_DN481_c2_g1_i4.p1  ORF type:complete len:399 (+),score=31.81 TRINITY_DN481_c2_g1_i4:49-1245(+)